MIRAAVVAGSLLLLSGVIFSVDLSRKQERQVEQEAAKIKELESKLQSTEAASANGSMKDQILCAREAERVFQFEQNEPRVKGSRQLDAGFVSHYQVKRGRCFVEIQTTDIMDDGKFVTSRTVNDAISHENLGLYIQLSDPAKPPVCDMIDTNGQKQLCESEDEFDQLARQYMK